MPGLQGPEVIQKIRARGGETSPTYLILLTARDSYADIVQGLKAGANDYVTKPANEDELIARVNVGARVVQLQIDLADRVRSLEEALANVKALQTLLPMCAYCKSIRNDQNYWEKVETYFTQHSNVSFTHSYCPNCYERYVRPELEALEGVKAAQDRQRQGR
jgi:DNA-binding response OmpR family regulator